MAKRKTARQSGRQGHADARGGPAADPRQRFGELVAAYQAGRFKDVVAGAGSLTRDWPEQVAGWNLLAEGCRRTGRLDEADAACRRALAIDPRSAEAHNNAGNVFRDRGDLDTAEQAFQRALSLKPGLVEARYNLANVLRDAGRLQEAVDGYRAAIEQRPGEATYHHALGLVLRQLREPEAARQALKSALAIRPDDAMTRTVLGGALRELGELDAARGELDRAIELDPELAEARIGLGRLLQVVGEDEAAAAAYQRAVELSPDDAHAWYGLSNVRTLVEGDPEVARMEQLLARPDRDDDARVHLHFALGRVYTGGDREPEAVFAHFREGARLKRGTFDYDADENDRYLERIAHAFPREWIGARRAAGDPTDAPVFVVGMPRSGSTLVEQILSTHARVHGAGERNDLLRLVNRYATDAGRPYPDWAADVPDEDLLRLGTMYRQGVVDPWTDVDRVVDKMPSNFLYLGLVAGALPNARIVHVRRSPLDTCLSCYTLLFSGWQPFSYDLEELGRYYRAYARLMEHWRAALPVGRMLELNYESIIDDPEVAVRALLDHCGLAWDPNCLDFHATARAVSTASTNQVRQPLYRSSVGRWRRFRSQLQPLIEALGPLAEEELR